MFDRSQNIKNRIKGILLSVLFSCALLICPGFIRAFSFKYDFVVSHAAYFLAVFFMTKRFEKTKVLIPFSFAIVPISLYLVLFGLRWPPTVILPNVVANVLGCVNGYLFASMNRQAKWVSLGTSFIMCVLYFFVGNNYWYNYLNYGTLNGNVKQKVAWISQIDKSADLEIARESDR